MELISTAFDGAGEILSLFQRSGEYFSTIRPLTAGIKFSVIRQYKTSTNSFMKKLSTISMPVPYKGPGNAISQKMVSFDVLKGEDHYALAPILNDDERRIANLPMLLEFTIENGTPVSMRGIKDGNFHVIESAVKIIREKKTGGEIDTI